MNVLLPLIIVGAGFFNNAERPDWVASLDSIVTEIEVVEPDVVETEVAETEVAETEVAETDVAADPNEGIDYVDASWSHLTPSTREAILMLVAADQMTRI